MTQVLVMVLHFSNYLEKVADPVIFSHFKYKILPEITFNIYIIPQLFQCDCKFKFICQHDRSYLKDPGNNLPIEDFLSNDIVFQLMKIVRRDLNKNRNEVYDLNNEQIKRFDNIVSHTIIFISNMIRGIIEVSNEYTGEELYDIMIRILGNQQ